MEDARRSIRHPAAGFLPHARLASALAHLDRREEAKIARDKLLEVEPNFSPDVILAAFSPLNPEALWTFSRCRSFATLINSMQSSNSALLATRT